MSEDAVSLSGSAVSSRALWQSVWRKVCFNVDGISIGTTIAALAEGGLLTELADAAVPVHIDKLAYRFGMRPGYLHLALRLLAGQGFIHYQKQHGSCRDYASLTADGISLLPVLPAYAQMPTLLEAASCLPDILKGDLPLTAELADTLKDCLGFPQLEALPPRLKERVQCHLLGPGVAVSLHLLMQAGLFDEAQRLPDRRISRKSLPEPANAYELALQLLAAQGWFKPDADTFILQEEGILAASVAAQYSMVLAYFPTFRGVTELLFEGHAEAKENPHVVDEKVNRHLDIEFSGDVFSRHCRQPLLDIALPTFNREALGAQPLAIVDTGCGDGTMLLELYLAIRDHSLRGKALDHYPLLAVGADTSPIACKVAKEKFARAGIPHLIVHGDIAMPEQLASELASHGVDMRDALHISKSVIHNRRYQPPQNPGAAASRLACSEALFVARDGTRIAQEFMEQNLMEFFCAWRPWTCRHGMIAIEAHAISPELIFSLLGESVISMLMASHGYSNQNLIDADSHRALAREAGFVRLASTDVLSAGDKPLLTLDYMQPLEGMGLGMLAI